MTDAVATRDEFETRLRAKMGPDLFARVAPSLACLKDDRLPRDVGIGPTSGDTVVRIGETLFRFDRTRPTAAVLEAFGAALRESVRLDEFASDLAAALVRTGTGRTNVADLFRGSLVLKRLIASADIDPDELIRSTALSTAASGEVLERGVSLPGGFEVVLRTTLRNDLVVADVLLDEDIRYLDERPEAVVLVPRKYPSTFHAAYADRHITAWVDHPLLEDPDLVITSASDAEGGWTRIGLRSPFGPLT